MPLIDTAAMAERLSCHEQTVRRMVQQGRIPCVQLGKEYRFDPDAVLNALNRKGDDDDVVTVHEDAD